MADIVNVSGARGESFADVARRVGSVGGIPVDPTDSDEVVMDKFAAAYNAPAVGTMEDIYATYADGLAAVGANDYFWVADDAAATLQLYQKGVSVGVGDPVVSLQTVGAASVQGSSATAFQIKQAGGTVIFKVDTLDAFTGYAGTLSSGAGRVRIGQNAASGGASGDDAALLITRQVVGDTHSHAVRDETIVNGTTVGNAYASFDAVAQAIGTGSPVAWDHFRGFQARMDWNRNGALTQYNSFGSTVTIHQGAVANAYDYYVANPLIYGGSLSFHVGLFMDVLTGATTSVSLFVQNDSYILANLTLAGALTGVTRVQAQGVHASAGAVLYNPGGGMVMCGSLGGSGFGGLQAYSDGSATPKGMTLQPTGGVVVVGGSGNPTISNVLVEVSGGLYATRVRSGSYTVATVPSAATCGPGASIYVSDEVGGAVMAFSNGTNWLRVTDRAIIS